MTVDNIITLIRNQTGCSSDNIADAVMITYVNIAYHDLENAICDKVDEDYFWDIFETDTVANQNEYVLQATNASTQGIKKINRVEVKRDTTDDYHTLLSPDSLNNFKVTDGYAQANQSTQTGKWEYRDGSIFLYPVPTVSVTDWLRIHAVKALIDLATGGAETTIFPNHSALRQYHQVIALGAIPWVERHRNVKDKNDIMASMNIYADAKRQMLEELNSIYNEPMESNTPNLETRY